MTKELEKRLTQFYADMQAWIDQDFPKDSIFLKSQGLCGNLTVWARRNDYDSDGLTNLQYAKFAEVYEPSAYPFTGSARFFDERAENTLYENPKRLAWIKDRAG